MALPVSKKHWFAKLMHLITALDLQGLGGSYAACSPLALATLSAAEGEKGKREGGQGKEQPQKEVQTFFMQKAKLN